MTGCGVYPWTGCRTRQAGNPHGASGIAGADGCLVSWLGSAGQRKFKPHVAGELSVSRNAGSRWRVAGRVFLPVWEPRLRRGCLGGKHVSSPGVGRRMATTGAFILSDATSSNQASLGRRARMDPVRDGGQMPFRHDEPSRAGRLSREQVIAQTDPTGEIFSKAKWGASLRSGWAGRTSIACRPSAVPVASASWIRATW